MFNQKGISSIIGLILILVFCVASFSLILYVEKKLSFEYNKEANILQSSDTLDWQTYTNNDYGFLMQFPNLWNGYTVIKNEWSGQAIDNLENPQKYTGPLFIFKNQDLAKKYNLQGIPLMVFTPDVWKLVAEGKIAVSAAPVGPEKIGENSKYVFALPPRWIGFADNLYENQARYSEVQQILKTFKTLPVVDTADWQTYTNTEYGFEFKYPLNWKVINGALKNGENGWWLCPNSESAPCPSGSQIYTSSKEIKSGEGNYENRKAFGSKDGKYFYSYLNDFPVEKQINAEIYQKIVSTFRFTK